MIRNIVAFAFVMAALATQLAYAIDATEIVRRADAHSRGNSSYMEMTMTIMKPDWSRTMSMKSWSLEPGFALVYVTAPARDKGTVTLKRGVEIWNWLPSVQREIKIPPSMMLQSWMGSDFTNDDLVKKSSIVEDYTHALLGEETLDAYDCYRVQLTPKPSAGVVWGKVIAWISKKDFLQLRAEYYDEDGTLVKTFYGKNVKMLGGRLIPTHWEMVPHETPNNKTVIDLTGGQFNPPLAESFFSLQNMRSVR